MLSESCFEETSLFSSRSMRGEKLVQGRSFTSMVKQIKEVVVKQSKKKWDLKIIEEVYQPDVISSLV